MNKLGLKDSILQLVLINSWIVYLKATCGHPKKFSLKREKKKNYFNHK
jgi:hypothetical protein